MAEEKYASPIALTLTCADHLYMVFCLNPFFKSNKATGAILHH